MENPIEMDDLGTPILGNTHIYIYYMLDYMKQCMFGTEPVFFFQESNLYGLHGLDGWYMFVYICIYRN